MKLDKRTKEYKEWKKNNSEGVGDTIEKITEATGIKKVVESITKDCGCEKRKELLNKMFPYRFKAVNCFTDKQKEQYKNFIDVRTLRLNNEQIKLICELYAYVFNKPYYEPCRNCSPKPLIKMIERLDIVYNSYNH